MTTTPRVWLLTTLMVCVVSACQSDADNRAVGHGQAQGPGAQPAAAQTPPQPTTRALDLNALSTVERILPELARKRVVLVGEQHTRYDHHLNQLEIIRGLHERDPDLAIGLEFFQQPFQKYLDQYVAADIDEQHMLEKTEYYRRWRFDYRLYRPILRFAREHGIPLIALNVPVELTDRVREVGLDGLNGEHRAELPEIDRSNKGYTQRLREVFERHPQGPNSDFEHFEQVQLLWDEGMAERAAQYLNDHPQQRMIILAGNGHVAYRSAIAGRLARRTPADIVTVLNGWQEEIGPEVGDYLLLSREQSLPPAGQLGLLLEPADKGLQVSGFAATSPAQQAGIEQGDRLVSIEGRGIEGMEGVRLALWDKPPGATVTVKVARRGWLGVDERTYEVELAAVEQGPPHGGAP